MGTLRAVDVDDVWACLLHDGAKPSLTLSRVASLRKDVIVVAIDRK
jgi:hypothetical protein